jgi:hypothetical protein
MRSHHLLFVLSGMDKRDAVEVVEPASEVEKERYTGCTATVGPRPGSVAEDLTSEAGRSAARLFTRSY